MMRFGFPRQADAMITIVSFEMMDCMRARTVTPVASMMPQLARPWRPSINNRLATSRPSPAAHPSRRHGARGLRGNAKLHRASSDCTCGISQHRANRCFIHLPPWHGAVSRDFLGITFSSFSRHADVIHGSASWQPPHPLKEFP
jgi:hypothetical protein